MKTELSLEERTALDLQWFMKANGRAAVMLTEMVQMLSNVYSVSELKTQRLIEGTVIPVIGETNFMLSKYDYFEKDALYLLAEHMSWQVYYRGGMDALREEIADLEDEVNDLEDELQDKQDELEGKRKKLANLQGVIQPCA